MQKNSPLILFAASRYILKQMAQKSNILRDIKPRLIKNVKRTRQKRVPKVDITLRVISKEQPEIAMLFYP